MDLHSQAVAGANIVNRLHLPCGWVGLNVDVEPPAVGIMSADGPAPKRQKTARAGTSDAAADGPIEDDKTAREKLREAGFDPDDVHTARSDMQISSTAPSGWYNITPMTHFAFHGDLPMCRYLYHVRGAVTTTAAQEHRAEPDRPVNYYPIYVAAYEYNFDIVKWLYQHGAKSELLEV